MNSLIHAACREPSLEHIVPRTTSALLQRGWLDASDSTDVAGINQLKTGLEGCSEEEPCKQESPGQSGERDTKSVSNHAQLWVMCCAWEPAQWKGTSHPSYSISGLWAGDVEMWASHEDIWRRLDQSLLEGKIYDKCWVQHRALKGVVTGNEVNFPAGARHGVKPDGLNRSFQPHSLSGFTAKAGENGGETLEMIE